MDLVDSLTLFIAGFNLGQLNYDKVFDYHQISFPLFLSLSGVIIYTLGTEIQNLEAPITEKFIFVILGDVGDFFAVAGFLYCYMNRVMTFVKDSKKYNWTYVFPALYIFVVILELIIAVGILKRSIYITLIYGGVSGLAVLTGLYYHLWFSIIIYNSLSQYKTDSKNTAYLTSITSLLIIMASVLAALNIVDYSLVYLAVTIDMSSFMVCNSIIIKVSRNIKLTNDDAIFSSKRDIGPSNKQSVLSMKQE
ncbi:hypothetical protein HDV06_006153 [Boothiomyces sp. JEL0866]|nr:hypothetical protein HDV06_006153 [Boothiomyces sp. JEL0866]